MPRKVERHWGDDGWFSGDLFCYYGEEVDKVGRLIGIEPGTEDHRRFLIGLDDAGRYFIERHNQRSEKFTRAEARAELEDIRKSKSFSWVKLSRLNARAYAELFFALLATTHGYDFESNFMSIALMQDQIAAAEIEAAIDIAIQNLKAKKEADIKPEIYLAVEKLCDLYEQMTGLKVSHSNKRKDLSYTVEPQSAAGKFVRACFGLIDEKVRPTQISASLRIYIEHKN